MPYPAENIINIVTNIRAAGLGTANFGAGMVFADFDSSTDATFSEGSYRDYGGASAVAADFSIASDPYLAALAWFSAVPKPRSLRIYLRQEDDTPVESLNDAINKRIWFYWFEFETTIRANDADVLALIAAGDAAGKFFAGTTNQSSVRDPSLATDIASKAKLQAPAGRSCSATPPPRMPVSSWEPCSAGSTSTPRTRPSPASSRSCPASLPKT